MITKFRIYEEKKLVSDGHPLIMRAGWQPSYVLKAYIENNPGIDLDIQCLKGWTPLIYAINNNLYDNATILINKGADPNIRTFSYGASFPSDTALTRFICQMNSSSGGDFPEKYDNSVFNFFKLLTRIVDINKNVSPWNPRPANVLPQFPPYRDVFNWSWGTPLIQICKDTVSGMVQLGPGVNASKGCIPTNVIIKLIGILINNGADLTIKDEKNKDFTDYLISDGNTKLLKKLCDTFSEIKTYLEIKKYNL